MVQFNIIIHTKIFMKKQKQIQLTHVSGKSVQRMS